MTFLSLAEGCRRLGVDPKTLRRWLALAPLPVESHASAGLSSAHLQLLARLHHRSLAPLPQDPPASAADELAAVPPSVLALPETLAALQAQIAALQQQVSTLTCLLQQHATPPASVASAAQHTTAAQPARPACRSGRGAAAATKPSPKPTHVLPRVELGRDGHYVVLCPKQGLLALEPDSPAWFAWLASHTAFRFVGKAGRLTAHREGLRVSRVAWRAHRNIHNHTYNVHLGPTQELTIAVLEQAAATLQSHLP